MRKQRKWVLQMNMNDPPETPRWLNLNFYSRRHDAEHEKRASKKRSPALSSIEAFRVIEG